MFSGFFSEKTVKVDLDQELFEVGRREKYRLRRVRGSLAEPFAHGASKKVAFKNEQD